MKIALLTTETTHHLWFLQQLMSHYNEVIVICEETILKPKYDTSHLFEIDQISFEEKIFFKEKAIKFEDLTRVFRVSRINDNETLRHLSRFDPDIIIAFGTTKIKAPIVETYKNKIINLHGGDPQKYRGLDSHLWAIYHEDWDNIVTTLHILNEKLDDGDIIQQKKIELKNISCLSQLRAMNTKACFELTLMSLETLSRFGYFFTRKQTSKGRYYSFMPSVLKEVCVKKFSRFVRIS